MKCFVAKPERGARKKEIFFVSIFLLKLFHSNYKLYSVSAQLWQQELFPQSF